MLPSYSMDRDLHVVCQTMISFHKLVFSLIHSYAKMWYGSIHHRTHVVHSNDPWWNSYYHLGKVSKSAVFKRTLITVFGLKEAEV